jgi:hypothetical protein
MEETQTMTDKTLEAKLKSWAEEAGIDLKTFTATFNEKLQKLKAAGTHEQTLVVAGKKIVLSQEIMAKNQTIVSIKGSSKASSEVEMTYYLLAQGEVLNSAKDTPYRIMYLLCQVEAKNKDLFYKIEQENNIAFIQAKLWSSAMFKPGFYTCKCKRSSYNGNPTFSVNGIAAVTEGKPFDINKAAGINPFRKFKVLSSYAAKVVTYGPNNKAGKEEGSEVLKSDGEPLRSRGITVLTQRSDGKQEIVQTNTTNEKWLDFEIDPNQIYQGILTKDQYPKLITPPMKTTGKIELSMDVDVPVVAEFTGLDEFVGKMVLLNPAFGGAEITQNDKGGKLTAFSTVSDMNGNTFKLSTFNPTLFDEIKTEGDELLPGIMKILVNIYEKDGSFRGTVLAIKDITSEIPADGDFEIDESPSSEETSIKKTVIKENTTADNDKAW